MLSAVVKVNRIQGSVKRKHIHHRLAHSNGATSAQRWSSLRRNAADGAASAEPSDSSPAQPSDGKMALSEILPGQKYEGTVKAVAAYGCFVDFGAESDGLVHISQLSNGYVKDVNSFISVGQKVTVKVMGVEGDNKVSLTMKDESAASSGGGGGGQGSAKRAQQARRSRVPVDHGLSVGDKVTGTVERIANFGAFLKLEIGFDVLLPTAEMSATEDSLDPNPNNLVSVGDSKEVTVLKVDGGKVSVTAISDEDRQAMAEASKGATSEEPASALGGSMLGDLAALGLQDLFAEDALAAKEPTA